MEPLLPQPKRRDRKPTPARTDQPLPQISKRLRGHNESALAWMQIAFIAILLRRLDYDGS
jgi:hypothetical protein